MGAGQGEAGAGAGAGDGAGAGAGAGDGAGAGPSNPAAAAVPRKSAPVRSSSAKTKLKGDELAGLDVLVVEDNEFQLRIVKVGCCKTANRYSLKRVLKAPGFCALETQMR